ncbi:MAG: MFS transporter [Atribacterota bacterium]|jgi:MFS family permease|nr:MFS transporter [Atribacterota bacterium]MDY0382514.1 MFS transporter [Atribacterota bacterium]
MNIKSLFEDYTKLPRSLFILFFAQIVSSMGNFVFPFLAIFLTKTLIYNEQKAGFYVMLATAAKVPGLLLGGKLSDAFGRKKIFIIFSTLSGLFIFFCLLVGQIGQNEIIPWLLIISAVFNGANYPAMKAMVADLTNPDNRKAAFSLLYLGTNIGFAIGPLIAGFLYNNYLKLLFVGDAATTIISVLLVYIFIAETFPEPDKMKKSKLSECNNERAEDGSIYQVLLSRPYLLIFTLIFTLYSFIYVQSEFTLPLQMIKIFGDNGPQYFGTIMTVNGIVVIFLTVIIISITRRIEPILNVSLAGLLYAIGFGIIYFSTTLFLFAFSTILWTLGEIIASTYSDVYIINHTPITHRGRFSAIIHILIGSGFIFGPYLSGLFISHYRMENIWLVVFILAIFSTFLMYLLNYFENQAKQSLKHT